ncbi:MAG: ribosomal-processing cysteine protease Prp [Lachnospiraceae bacterium]|nr:ribosomal-processing cysteine protease Prp [Lachnospiraceae bacterium]MEE1015279.1 ribosomal-processing cysteine protease Prp [Lachnospiraceae bacterium]
MITIEIRTSGEEYVGFSSKGHAGYAEEGYDIICAAVSALTVNTINSIEKFTEDAFKAEAADGMIRWKFTEFPLSKETKLLMDSLVLGLEDIQENYGKKYIKIVKKDLTK